LQQTNPRKLSKKEINQIEKVVQDVKEELKKDIKSLTEKNQTDTLKIKSSLSQVKNTVESNQSRLEQVEHRISGLKEKIDIKGKEEYLKD
jgi:gas vesicle protein